MKHLMLLTLFILSGSSAIRAQGQQTIRWPDSRYPTLQRAIDALADGGELRIAGGVFDVTTPLIIQDKWISIRGRGCDELPNQRGSEVTHLVGPRPSQRVSAADAVGLFNFINGGGLISGLKLSGFDAGIRGRSDDDPSGGPSAIGARGLRIAQSCITDTGRGIAWSAKQSLEVANVVIRDLSWNGISVFPPMPGGSFSLSLPPTTLTNVEITLAANSCVVLKNTMAVIQGGHYHHCGLLTEAAAIGLSNSGVTIQGLAAVGPTFSSGIQAHGGATLINNIIVHDAQSAGVLFEEPIYGEIRHSVIANISPSNSTGFFGDGVDVKLKGSYGGEVLLDDVTIDHADRAGVGNFGGLATLHKTKIMCTGFSLNSEIYQGQSAFFTDAGGNQCGCPAATDACVDISSSLSPPMFPPLIE